jgi:2-aminoadipate transaminase
MQYDVDPNIEGSPAHQIGGTPLRPVFARWLGATNDITRSFLAAARVPGLINLAGGLPAPESYPSAELAAIARAVIEQHPQDTLGYGPVEGLPELRDAIARRFSAPNLRLARENVLVTSGGMQALDLVGKVLLDDGDLIAGQFPTYLGALDAWRPRNPIYRNMVLDGAEFDPAGAMRGAQFAYAVPNFSNPTGRLVDLAKRQALVAAAHATGTWLIEDDPYGTLLYDGVALPRLLTLSADLARAERPYDGPVVSMGTLSKEIAPGLRVGWVVASPGFIDALTKAKQGSDMCTSGITQRIALAALESGLVDRLQPLLTSLYRERRDALCAAMTTHLAQWFEWEVPVGGMFVWATARNPGFDTDKLLQVGLQNGVCVAPSSAFDPLGRNRGAIRLNFTLNPPDQLVEGVRRLAASLRAMPG